MRRPLLLGIAVCAVAVITQGPPSSPPRPALAQGVHRVEYRSPEPSCAEGIRELGLEGQPVSCEEPPPPTHDPPQMHGKFRLVPENYVGPLTYEDIPDTAPRGVVSNDVQAIRTSSMYAEPAWLPQGYSLSSLSTRGADSEHMIAAVYTGPSEPIQVNRVRQLTWPINLILPVRDSAAVFETPVLAGKDVVLSYPKSGFSGQTVLSFVDGDIETNVFGDRLDPSIATRIALSLICSATCAASPAAIGGYPDGSSNTPAGAQGAAEPSAVGTGNASTTSGAVFPNQVRVMAGLGTPDANVRTLASGWHGFGYPPGAEEAALDLQDPRGSAQTAGEDVWVTTWPWSGAGQLRFTTEEYEHDPSWCGGRYVRLEDTGYHYLGKLTYVHLDYSNEAPVGDTWLSNQNLYWTIHWVGKVANWQKDGCPFETIHLHQGQRVYDGTQMTYNSALGTPYITFSETDYTNKWMHSLPFVGSGDSDGDGCTDQEELGPNPDLGGQRDPYNYRDFYDITDITFVIGAKDRGVSGFDLNMILQWLAAVNDGPPNPNGKDYDADSNGNGLEDGWEIDYASINGHGTGPDGGISGFDLDQMMYESGDSCAAPP